MITEKDLQEAIAECQGQRNPNANTCIKLAAFLTIQRELFGESEKTKNMKMSEQPINYSFQSADKDNQEKIVDYPIDTEFGKLIDGQIAADVWDIMQELMDALQITNPKLYSFAIRRLERI